MQQHTASPDPRRHRANVSKMPAELVRHFRDDSRRVDEPKAQAFFEAGAKVLQGLQTAFSHDERGSEPGPRR